MRTAFGQEFDLPEGYLNTASIGVPPASAADALVGMIDDWRRGAARPPDFDPAVTTARAAFADLVEMPADRVAIGASVSALVGLQSLGWLPVSLDWADAVVCAGYKWLMCPRGVAWLALGAEPRMDLIPHQACWYAGGDVWASIYGLPLRLADSARRFDTSPVWFSQAGAAMVLPWLAGLDRGAVREHSVGLADTVRAGLGMPSAGSAIVAVDRPGAAERLAAAGVVGSLRAGAVRLAFHLYNTAGDAARVLDALA